MTISMIVQPLLEQQERVRREQGDAAADELAHSQTGAILGMTSGAMVGAAVGSVVPVVGTAIGFVVGGMAGAIAGGDDKTGMDNLKSAVNYVSKMVGWLK